MVFKFLIEIFRREEIDFALMGGFALQVAGVTRTTRDIDLLILGEHAKKVKDIMLRHGYELIHESEDVLNFSGKKLELGRVDFLLAHRKYTKEMLKRAEAKEILESKFKIKVLRREDLIGLKVQSSSNDPERMRSNDPERMRQDMADIEAIIKNNYSKLDINLVREYFRLFNREEDLENILEGIKNA